ncbi:glycosyl transferase [Solibacillus silvestris]|nr:glycosyltransferase [Solibacillus silvestris]OBW58414.1 glycosyl transferase [Solibacillus silvestris]
MKLFKGVFEIKILHVCEYTAGGISTYIKEVLDYQITSSQITKVSIVLSDYKANKQIFNNINPHFYHYVRKPKYYINAMKEIKQVIEQEEPDIIHVHSTFAGIFVRLPLWLKKNRPRIIYCSHGWSFSMEVADWKKRIYSIIERFLALKTDMIINISKSELVNSLKYNLPAHKSTVIYSGIAEKLPMQHRIVNLQLDNNKINLLFVGRFDRAKGLDVLLDFWRENDLEHINLYIIGESILQDSKINLPENINLIGWVDNQIIDSYYQLFDAVIVPSRWEGFGLVAIEAMKNHKALIVSNRGALLELVVDGHNGYIFDLEDTESLLSILLNIDKEKLKEMGGNGFHIFTQKFTSDLMNQAIIDLYRSVLNTCVK